MKSSKCGMCQCSRKKTAASVPALDALATLTPTAPSQCNHVTASTVAATNHCMSHDVFGAHSTGADNATPFDACADRSQSGAVSDHASGITSLNHAIEHSAAALQPSIVVTAAPADAPVDSFQPTAAALSASDDTAVAAAHALGQVQRPEVGTDACSFQTSGVAPDPHSFSLDIIDNSGNDFVDAVDAFSEDVAIESLTLTMGNDHSVPIVACPAGGLVRTVHFAPTICIEAFMLPSHTLLQ